MLNYEKTSSGFLIRISLWLYARPAVIKALYAYRDRYLIYYEIENEELVIFFEPIHNDTFDLREEVSSILKDLDFQMIRYDTMKQTKEIRELLVARALYTTCIEPDHEIMNPEDEVCSDSWKNDTQNLFSSWATDEAR